MRLSFRFLSVLSLAVAVTACGDDSSTSNNRDGGLIDGGVDGSVGGGSSTGGRATGGGGSGGRSGGGSGGSSGSAPDCDDLDCEEPATCDDSADPPRCACPEGYDDVNDDGSECEDIDECDEGTDNCPDNATCENTEGSFECDCEEDGFIAVDGECLKENAEDCEDGDECASGYCVGGVCCGEACDSPGLCERQQGTVCVNGDECRYGKEPDDTECDDGNACTESSCFDGVCEPYEVETCDDENACTQDSCDPESGECTNEMACDDRNPCTSDVCDPAVGCSNPPDNAASCTDDNPCTTDSCSGGLCVSEAMDCSELTNDCNEGVCVDGTCEAQPGNADGACSMSLTSCDATGSCNNSGACIGNDDACGDLATGCATCTGSANGCQNGRRCTCETPAQNEPPIVVVGGVCVEDTNECNADPCDDIAVSCNDPTPNGSVTGDFVCTCPDGYTGSGRRNQDGCVDINECAGGANPCGAGVAPGGCNGSSPPGSYSCTCAAGFRQIRLPSGDAKCVCDLSGTYEVITTTTVQWNDLLFIENPPPGGIPTESWSLRYHEVSADGTLTVTTVPCGGEVLETCVSLEENGTALLQPPFPSPDASLAPYQPNQIWGKPGMIAQPDSPSSDEGVPIYTVNVRNVVPGANASYVEPQISVLAGISLADRDGAWPPCRQCVGLAPGQMCSCPAPEPIEDEREDPTVHTVTNQAFWVDSDGLDSLGNTTFFVPPGGLTIGATSTDPPYNFTSPACPRLANEDWDFSLGVGVRIAPPLNLPCAYLTDKSYGATRLTSRLRSTQVQLNANNSCVIRGTVTGPNGGNPRIQSRTMGCHMTTQQGFCLSAGGPRNCNNAEVNAIDSAPQNDFTVSNGTFVMRDVTSQINLAPIMSMQGAAKENALRQACQQLRVRNCPEGRTCTAP